MTNPTAPGVRGGPIDPVFVTNPVTIDGVVPVSGNGLTNEELRATPVPVTVGNFPSTQPVSGTFWQATQPVSAIALPLPSGAATSANQISGGPQTNTGTVTATTQRVTLATDGPGVANLASIATNTGRIPAQGAALIDASTPVNIASNQVVPVSIASTLPVTGADDVYHDAFGRSRSSEPNDRANVEFMLDKSPMAVEEFSAGSGSSAAYNSTTRDVTLAIGNATNGTERGMALKHPIIYTPGHSQQIDITGTLDYAGLGSGTATVFLRSNGVDVGTPTTQANWTGTANANGVDWSKSQIFGVDFQSLRVGRLRFYLVRAGVPLIVHQITNDNLRPNGYWQYANLRPYWRVYNTGGNFVAEFGYGDSANGCGFRWTRTANASASALAVCATVISEGGENLFDIPGYPFRFSNGATTKTVSTTLIPLVSIQVQTTFNSLANRTLVIPESIAIQTDNPIYVEVRLNPTLTGAAFASIDANSSVFGDTTASAVSGGTVIDADYYGSGGNKGAGARTGLTGRVPMSTNWGATAGDILSICGIRVGNNNAAAGAVAKWKELR